MKSILVCSTLLAAVAANTCDDCTAVVTVLANGLVSDESIANQQVGLAFPPNEVDSYNRPSLLEVFAQRQKTSPSVRLDYQSSGKLLLLVSGLATMIPR